MALAACGSTTHPTAAAHSTPSTAAQSTPAPPPAAPARTTTTGSRRAKPSLPKVKPRPGRPPLPPRRIPPAHKISRAQQAAQNAAAIAKANRAQPSVFLCLTAAGLKHPRRGVENGVWMGTDGNASLTDTNAQVVVSGPYKSAQAAAALAKSLRAIEFTAAGGVFMASTPKTSHLDAKVTKVAACLASRAG